MQVFGFNAAGSIDAEIDGFRVAVPDDMSNGHRRRIRDEWESKGKAIPEYTPPAPKPPALTKRQVNGALILGKNITNPNGAVEFAISHIESPVARALALNDWQNAPYYDRSHPLFNDPAMLAAMGFKASDVDDLWAYGLTLPV